MKKLACIFLSVALFVSTFVIAVSAWQSVETETPMTAELSMAYGGVNGIVSMTFDDGNYATAVWLNEMFAKYDLRGSCMMIASKINSGNVAQYSDLFDDGYLEPECHSWSHMMLPDPNKAQYEENKQNNTVENFDREVYQSGLLLEQYFGQFPLCYALPYDTLHPDAMENYAKKYYYAVRSGARWDRHNSFQSLDPTPGSDEVGGWYNLMMMISAGQEGGQLIRGLDHIAENGGWYITMCHEIYEGAGGDSTYEKFEPVLQYMSELQKEGKIWVTTFGDATKYIRERQNTTVSFVENNDAYTLTLTMAEKTADNLSLDPAVFNHPLTVKLSLPNGANAVRYECDGEAYMSFAKEGESFVCVDVVPDGRSWDIEYVSVGDDERVTSLRYYDCTYDAITDATPVRTEALTLGQTPNFPTLPIKRMDNGVYKASGYTFYRADGTAVDSVSTVTDTMLGQTYTVCVTSWEPSSIGYAVATNGRYEYFDSTVLTADLSGKHIVLFADVTSTGTLTGSTLDLNGHSITPETTLLGEGSRLISSAPGAVVYGEKLINTTSKQVPLCNAGVTIGAPDSERIAIYTGIMAYGSQSYKISVYNCDLFNTQSHGGSTSSGTMSWFALVQTNRIELYFEGCNIYALKGLKILRAHKMTNSPSSITFKDSNLYGTIEIFGRPYYSSTSDRADCGELVLSNTKMYGSVNLNLTSMPWGKITVDENCSFSSMDQPVTLPIGYAYSQEAKSGFGSVTYPADGKQGGTPTTLNLSTYSTYELYETGDLGPALFYYLQNGKRVDCYLTDFTAAFLKGKKIVLLGDVALTGNLDGVTVDLNGYTINAGNYTLGTSGSSFYYSSVAGASIISTDSLHKSDNGDSLYIGYLDANTKSNVRISLVVKQIAPKRKDNTYLHACDIFTTYEWKDSDKNNNALISNQQTRVKVVEIENCRFYCATNTVVFAAHNLTANKYTISIKNTEFYGKGNLICPYTYDTSITTPVLLDLEGVSTYGDFKITNGSNSQDYFKVNIGAGCSFASIGEGRIASVAEGLKLVPNLTSVTLADQTYTIANGTVKTFAGGTYTNATKYGTAKDLSSLFATFYRNVSLDVSINFNLYIPTDYALEGDYDTVVIGGAEYYVVTVKTAPKDATGDNFIPLTIGGVEVEYNASLVGYMGALLHLEPTSDYVAASQNMAQYVLYYVKSAAQNAYGEVDIVAIDGLLTGFALTEKDKELENVQTNAPIKGVEQAALNLSSNVGFVFKVEENYNGTLTVTFNGKTTIYDYTETPADADTYVLLDGIEAFKFTGNVVVTNSEGDTFIYNVATYVNNVKTDVAYATYAYAKAATVYNATWGTPKVIE